MMTVIIFIAILSILVIAHEFGHFYTARKAGMKVYEFGLGFPPRAFGYYKDPKTKKWVYVKGKGKSSLKETVGGEGRQEQEEYPDVLYSVNWLPLGGFVKIKGENGEDPNDKDSFGYHVAWKRFIVIVSGVTMNVLLAGVLLGIGFMIGLPTDISEGIEGRAIIEDPSLVVQQVSDDTPASVAGIKFNDKILTINNEKISNSEELVDYIRNKKDTELSIVVDRGGEELTFVATPAILESHDDDIYRLGIATVDVAIVRFPWYTAIYKGFVAAFIGFVTIFYLFIILIKNLIMGQGMAYEVSGPVGIASMVGQSARMGINYLISTSAMLSITLAVINILPIPALDGGRALFIIVEKVIRKPIPIKYEQLAHTIGFALLMLLVLIVTVKDVFKLAG
jgi:regulator of sigma E protease